ncbi:MAG TPA: hypothetical protein VGJ93_01810 [Desulfuromonadaceae bacterium]
MSPYSRRLNELAHEVIDEALKEARGAPPGTVFVGDEGVAYPGEGIAGPEFHAAYPGKNIINSAIHEEKK